MELAAARAATRKYVANLRLAKADGYGAITRLIPNTGHGFINRSVRGFDVRKPPILVYERRGSGWQLTGVEWVFGSKPARALLPGARYAAVRSGCQYADGTFVPATARAACPQAVPGTGSSLAYWRPGLVTLHVWLWYPNPRGLYASTNPSATYTNPLVAAYTNA